MLLLSAEQAARVHALATEILETLDKSYHISLDVPAPKTAKVVANTGTVVEKTGKRTRKNRKRLSASTIQQIRTALDSGLTIAAVAHQYSISYPTVSKIARGDTYKGVAV